MKLSLMGRIAMATLASLALGLSMTACGGGTVAFMWVLGQQYQQITGYQVDDYTGNLTQIPGSPFSTNGVNPVYILVKAGGRFVYVINQGVTGTGSTTVKSTSSGIALYSVGNDGILTFQQSYQSQGEIPMYAQFDTTGTYLYVLDQYGPGTTAGAITAFASDPSTGRLTLVTNIGVKTTAFPAGLPYFPVGTSPTITRSLGGCLLTLDSATNSIYPYSFGGGGQLVLTATGEYPVHGAVQLSSINGNGVSVYLTDIATNTILPFMIGGGCSLSSAIGGNVANITGTSSPVNTLVDNSGKYLYVLNNSNFNAVTPVPYSSISAFTINSSTQQLQPIAGSPYTVGAGPVCIVEDPTNQYLYISNRDGGTVSGKIIDSTTGELSDLSRGSTFPASGVGSCLAISGAID